jgi:hypothetical protein
MVREALSNPKTSRSKIYVRDSWYATFRKIQKNKNIFLLPELPYQGSLRPDNPTHWGSGSYAVLVSASLCEDVTLIGFDLYGRQGQVNNIYKNTENYAKEESAAIDHSYWVYQISKVFDCFPNTRFKILNHHYWCMPEEWQKNNVEFVAL